EVIGVLGLASYEKREFGVQAEFLETLAGSVAVGLQNARLFDAARRAEKEVRELNAGLEDKVSERTAQLQETNAALSLEIEQHLQAREEISWLNNDLLQRSQELERANTELETFSYSISHDLKAPLRHLIGFSRILQEDFADTLPPEAANFIDRIDRSSRKMVVMVDALLELSRITKSVLCRKQVDLSAMARELVTELRETSPDREVTVEIAEGLTASADPILIRVVLQNLLGNAWKYSRNVPHARIGFFATEEDGTTTYGIRDNGTGFDMAHTDKLFGAFQRLHGAEFEGTGIGLATVQRIIHRHGGKVWAESRPGAGATFHFTLG
ncbi:hypothetical protein EG829_16500, partial [bacterium]|nr:hypothetical protein [bacterium]